jgi:hypothetical protein
VPDLGTGGRLPMPRSAWTSTARGGPSLIPPGSWVCSACGTRSCFLGDDLCADMLRAPIAPCTCDWDDVPQSSPEPYAVNPNCQVHGDEIYDTD